MKSEKKVSLSHEKLVDFVLQTIEEINKQNCENQFIADSFKKCGLNPWSKERSLQAFQEHLDFLESNEILKAMITNQNALPLLN